MKRINRFVKTNKVKSLINEASDEDSEEEELFIQSFYASYQLKTKYRKKVVDEIEFDIDDEDEIILLKQPYDTVMSVGHSDMLNHLQTTFLARRSDIIVSSTLSITLTPKDDEFIPTSFARIENDEITDWVNLR